MTRAQRLVPLALAALVAVIAVVALGGGSDGKDPVAARATPTPAPTAVPTREPQELEPRQPEAAEPASRPQPPLLTAGKERDLTFTQGDRIAFRVRADGPEEVHVHGYDIERPVPDGKTVTIAFEGDVAGIFEVELHGSGAPLGRLRIQPD
jgi:hypothetical protein